MESYLHYKTQLEADLEIIINELKTIAVHDKQTDDWTAVPIASDLKTADLNEEADAVEEWNVRQALMVQLETRYKNIKRALRKFDSDTYGICEVSGEPIEPNRLAANPAARTNIANRENESQLPN
jgi:RNA polymerase-binding transcription factor DksA